jgi:choice-of-anchor C domain-containing protein
MSFCRTITNDTMRYSALMGFTTFLVSTFGWVSIAFELAANNAAPASLVANGSFELGENPRVSTNLNAINSTSIDGWTVESGSVDYIGSRWVARDGVRCIDLSGEGPGTLSQQILSLSVGQRYRLSFFMAGNPELLPALGVIKRLRATIGTASQEFSFNATGKSPFNMGWEERTLEFTATASVLKLSFTSLIGNSGGPALDKVSITPLIEPTNQPPIALAQSIIMDEDGSVSIDLMGQDPDGDALTFLVDPPSHGTLLGIAPEMLYRPNKDYFGADTFQYRVSDGRLESAKATVTITIRPIQDPPSADSQTIVVDEDAEVAIRLTGQDPDGDTLTFFVDVPSHGTLSGTAPNLVYKPSPDYFGSDTFQFRVTDGQFESPRATVSITVRAIQDPPVALPQTIALDEDGQVPIRLTGQDPDGDPLTFLVDQPSHGTLSGTAPDFVYKPNQNYSGSDAFQFRVSDGRVESARAAVSITVRAVQDAPTAVPQTITVDEDGQVPIRLTGQDPDGDPLTFLVDQPNHGTLSGTGPDLVYKPNGDYFGSDTFQFRVSDGQSESASATVEITVHPVQDPPIAVSQKIVVNEDGQVAIHLTGQDPDGDHLTFLVDTPGHGTLSGTGPDLLYKPNQDYFGSDMFQFRVSDGQSESAKATVTITVLGTPVAVVKLHGVTDVDGEGTWIAISPNGSNATVVLDGSTSFDPENDPLEFLWSANGSATPFANGPLVTNQFELGEHLVTLTVDDGHAIGQTTVVFEVLTIVAGLEELCAQIEQSSIELNRKRPLLATCEAGRASFKRGNSTSGVNQLQALQGKLETQIGPRDRDLASRWNAFVESILKAATQQR